MNRGDVEKDSKGKWQLVNRLLYLLSGGNGGLVIKLELGGNNGKAWVQGELEAHDMEMKWT